VLALIAVMYGVFIAGPRASGAAQDTADRPRALLHIAADPPRVVFSNADQSQSPSGDASSYARYVATQQALIKSRLVLGAAMRTRNGEEAISQLDAIKNRPNRIAWLEQNLDVTNVKDTELVQISMRPGAECGTQDQVAIINSVADAYIGVVVGAEVDKLKNRLNMLRKVGENYHEMLRDRRNELRALRSKLESAEALIEPEKEALKRLLYDLLKQGTQVNMERAETEALLARRKQAADAATDVGRKEIGDIQERLDRLTVRGSALDRELDKVRERLKPQRSSVDIEELKEDIASIQAASRKVAQEVEALNIELKAPPRIRVIEHADLRAR
jgi:hypothetical protein